jgi:peroxiredoxin
MRPVVRVRRQRIRAAAMLSASRSLAVAALWVLLSPAPAPAWQTGAALLEEPSRPVAALDFSATTLAGTTVRLSELRGQVVFLNFWATWCVPCKAEMPAMERVHQALRGQSFRMAAVNLQEDPASMRKFVDELGLTFDIVLDPTGEITRNYGVNNLPLTYLIDKRGRIVARALGERPWDGAPYLAYVRNLLRE